MPNRQIEIEGYGVIIYNTINVKDKEYENVGLDKKPLKWVSGSAIRGHFENEQGLAVPDSQVMKKVELEGETFFVGKLKPTSEVSADDVEIVDDNSEIYTAIERKSYKVFTDSPKLKKLLVDEKKTLKFPVTFGNGYKVYSGVLTLWNGQMVLCGCRGDINEVLKQYVDDEVEIEIATIVPQAKKLLRAFS